MSRNLALMAVLCAAGVFAQTNFFPIKDLKPGMRGTGKTVFSGDRIEDFGVEILGVLENIGPKQSLILARLSGGPLEKTGVLQGMSGSPVYIDGKLVGAVAMAFPYAKEPIAGIRPIEEMVRITGEAPPPKTLRALAVNLTDRDLTRLLPKREETAVADTKAVDIATPIHFSGFSRGALDQFEPQLRSLGLEPRQGVASGGKMDLHMGDPASLKPGSMISVQLMTGDMSVGADGTVTYIDGSRVYAFGHRFLAVGPTALPFARSEVLTLMPVLSTSFKISSPKELLGTISEDRNTAIAGSLGKRAAMVPMNISLSRGGRKLDSYKMQMVSDRLLSPLLVQMAVFSAIDATERTSGASSFVVHGQIGFQGVPTPVRLDNMFSGDNGSAAQVATNTAIPLAYILQTGFDNLQIQNIDLDIEAFNEKKQLQIEQVTIDRREVRPGEKVHLTAVLSGENGSEISRTIEYQVPSGMPAGTLYFTVADGQTTNITEYKQIIGNQPRTPAQVVALVNGLRGNSKAYVRVWRQDPAFQLDGQDMPDPPASVAMILNSAQTSTAGIQQTRNSKVAELEMGAGAMVINGSKTIQVEVKE